jgi:hypothetical protein
MNVEFGDVFAGEAGRGGKPQYQGLIQLAALPDQPAQ